MTNSLSNIPAVSCNPELSACPPFCDIAKSDNPIPQYCISSEHSGDCFNCPLHDGCKDCQGHEFSICLADYLEEPDRPSYCSQNGGDIHSMQEVTQWIQNPLILRQFKRKNHKWLIYSKGSMFMPILVINSDEKSICGLDGIEPPGQDRTSPQRAGCVRLEVRSPHF